VTPQISTAVADQIEQDLLARLTSHPVLRDIESLPQELFVAVLLQRRFISLIFPTIYDMGIDALCDATALRLARQILREEYPDKSGRTPSHREDLVSDLEFLGAAKGEILASRPSSATAAMVADTLKLMADASVEASDVRVLAMLRFWGEVVVSVEYGEYWRRMEGSFDAGRAQSRFFLPHHSHDGRESLSMASKRSRTHSGRLGACLKQLLNESDANDAFVSIETEVVEIRLRFYDQFC
jgi:hypothetical protein